MNGQWTHTQDRHGFSSPTDIVRMLVDSVSRGGNTLLNVGPTARGEFGAEESAILGSIGHWMRRHGKAIHGAGPARFIAPPDARYTARGTRLYLHLFAWPHTHIHLPGLRGIVRRAQFMHDSTQLELLGADDVPHGNLGISGLTEDTLTIIVPRQRPDELIPVIELFLTQGAESEHFTSAASMV